MRGGWPLAGWPCPSWMHEGRQHHRGHMPHARLQDVYGEVIRVLKPGGRYVCGIWMPLTTCSRFSPVVDLSC
jgi:SAM-dependent methyltransferase